jgi:hypothetical protein
MDQEHRLAGLAERPIARRRAQHAQRPRHPARVGREVRGVHEGRTYPAAIANRTGGSGPGPSDLLDMTRVRLAMGLPLTPAPMDLEPVGWQAVDELDRV